MCSHKRDSSIYLSTAPEARSILNALRKWEKDGQPLSEDVKTRITHIIEALDS